MAGTAQTEAPAAQAAGQGGRRGLFAFWLGGAAVPLAPVFGGRTQGLRAGTLGVVSDNIQARRAGSTAHPIGFRVATVDGGPATGKAPLVEVSRDGGATWAAAQGAVAERGHGWYTLAGHAGDRAAAGTLLIRATAAGARPAHLAYDIVAYDPYAAVALPAAERTAIADAALTRDWAEVVGTAARRLLQAVRSLRNRRQVGTDNVMTVFTESPGTAAWAAAVRGEMDALPVRGLDPIEGHAPPGYDRRDEEATPMACCTDFRTNTAEVPRVFGQETPGALKVVVLRAGTRPVVRWTMTDARGCPVDLTSCWIGPTGSAASNMLASTTATLGPSLRFPPMPGGTLDADDQRHLSGTYRAVVPQAGSTLLGDVNSLVSALGMIGPGVRFPSPPAEWQGGDGVGVPTSGFLPVYLRVIENTILGFDPDFVAVCTDPASGTVECELDLREVGGPGIYVAEFAVLCEDMETVALSNQFNLVVERGLFGGDPTGMPTLAEIRMLLRDSPQHNELLGDYAWSVPEIVQAMQMPVDYWNAELPDTGVYYTTQTFPAQYRHWWVRGTVAALYDIASESQRRNQLEYSAGGLQVNDQARSQEYAQAAQAIWQEFKAWVRNRKIFDNNAMCWGTTVGYYTD